MDTVCSEVPRSAEKKSYIAIEGMAHDAESAIRLCGKALQERGCVTDAFAQSCIDREGVFPTGICTEIPVALPHCKSDAILKSALCYLRLKEPVEFRRMDDDEETVATRHIFNLAIAPGDHLEFLAKTMQLLQDSNVVRSFESMDIQQVADYLESHIE